MKCYTDFEWVSDQQSCQEKENIESKYYLKSTSIICNLTHK